MPTAHGTFRLEMSPAAGTPPELGRFEFDKTFEGDLVGISHGAMLSAGDPASGSAGYVVVEIVEAELGGKRGGFALQHFGLMEDGTSSLRIEVTPGSGRGELAGIRGTFELTVEDDGTHRYALEHTLPG